MKAFPLLATSLVLIIPGFLNAAPERPPVRTKADVVGIIREVNDHWQSKGRSQGNAFWNTAVYHVGNMDAYQVTREPDYRNYSLRWARKNHWEGARSDKKEEWKYHYGENDRHVLFGDWQVCFQVYMELNKLKPERKRTARAIEVFEYQIATPQVDYIWWSDGLFMVMPTMSELYQLTKNEKLLDRLHDYFVFSKDLMFDKETGLFFRDAKYVYPKHKSVNGRKDFWARGNGWVFAALPRVIDDLPADHEHRDDYLQVFRAMAAALAESQQEDGCWTRSILDPEHAPGPEASGTSFFTYGFLWGLNNGVLGDESLPVAGKGWRFLTGTALQENGTVGYMQPIGEKAIPGQVVDANSVTDFGTGAFLMAAAEMVRFMEKRK